MNISTTIPPFMNRQAEAFLNDDKARAISTWPIYGGSPDDPVETETVVKKEETITKPVTQTETGTEGTTDPKVTELTQQLEQLQKNLEQATTTIKGHEAEKDKASRAQLSKEENLQKDLELAQNTIARMDSVIQHVALTSAFATVADVQWNSVKQAMAELREDEYDITIDLDNGRAEVSGIDKAAARIAKEFPWLVKSTGAAPPLNGHQPVVGTRASGRPPAPPRGNPAKTEKRANLIDRFPVVVNKN